MLKKLQDWCFGVSLTHELGLQSFEYAKPWKTVMEGGLVPSLNCKTGTLASAQGETERISKLYKSYYVLGYLTMITYFFPQNLSFLEDPYCEYVP